jgi:phosphatidate phosphatase LPIN
MELLELAGYKSSYIHMSDLVDHFFPPVRVGAVGGEEFTDLRYWKLPLPELSDESDEDGEDQEEGDDVEEGEEDEEGDEGDDAEVYLNGHLMQEDDDLDMDLEMHTELSREDVGAPVTLGKAE